MKKKDKKVTLNELEIRLESDENSWTKLLGSMGDFARYWRQLEAQVKKDKRELKHVKKYLRGIERRLAILEGSSHTHVAN